MTLNDNWGYSKHDDAWKTPHDVIQKLLDITSKGGNFLLGIGPKADGDFPEMSKEILGEIKDYMVVNAEAIHGTSPCPLPNGVSFGRITTKVKGDETTLYVHVFDQYWPTDGQLVVKGLYNMPVSAELLAGTISLNCRMSDEGLVIAVPTTNPGKYSTTIKLVIEGALDIKDAPIIQASDGTLTLPPADAILSDGSGICKETLDGVLSMGCWSGDLERNNVKWHVKINTPGTYTVKGDIASFDPGSFRFTVGDNAESVVSFQGTGGWGAENFQVQEMGQVHIEKAGLQYVEMAPIAEGWNPLGMRNVVLVPNTTTGVADLKGDEVNIISQNQSIRVQFTLPESAMVGAHLYDAQGRMLDARPEMRMEQGGHVVSFDGLQPGFVILSASIDGHIITRKVVVSSSMN